MEVKHWISKAINKHRKSNPSNRMVGSCKGMSGHSEMPQANKEAPKVEDSMHISSSPVGWVLRGVAL
ncbi:unnamed protein product [Haemonchus placei]|uniref:Ovule protein n=1 Tax=Haemonchus placei TaxID=6290 RepID=A0A158QPS1_HAEPC|nr:unnamed protein product [Haemonchus placei]